MGCRQQFHAPVKETPLPNPAYGGELREHKLDFDPPAGGKSAQIHDLRRRDRGVSGDFTIC